MSNMLMRYRSGPTQVNSAYQSSLSLDSPTFQSPVAETLGLYYFDLIRLGVESPGTYTIRSESSANVDGLVYSPAFDPRSPTDNLYQYDRDSDGNGQFRIQLTLSVGQSFDLVITTSVPDVIASFNIIAEGPSSLDFTHVARTFLNSASMIFSSICSSGFHCEFKLHICTDARQSHIHSSV